MTGQPITALPSLDVIVNNFNYGRFLAAAIDSALAQTHPAVAVIVVDDGSADHSGDVIASYGERIVPVLKPNGGQASAMNAGFERSCAEVVMFLDADDVLLPNAAALVAGAFMSDPSLAKVQFRMELIDGEGRKMGQMRPAPHYPLPSGDLRRLELTAPFDIAWFPTSANAFPAWVLRRIFPIPEEEFAGGGDWYLKHLAALFGNVRSLDETAAYYRIHGLNLYESDQTTLDLGQLRKTISLSATTLPHLERTARELALECPEGPILSVADVANRMISVRLDARAHPIGSDTRLRLLRAGARAAWRRVDVSPLMRLLFVAWFAAAAAAPRPTVPWLANLFLFPERRPLLNPLLRLLQRA